AADLLGETISEVPAAEVPGFHAPAVEGHGATLRTVRIAASGKHARVLGSRTHYYEGKGVRAVAHGVRTAAAAGCSSLVLPNGCRGLNRNWAAGAPVLTSNPSDRTGTPPS